MSPIVFCHRETRQHPYWDDYWDERCHEFWSDLVTKGIVPQ